MAQPNPSDSMARGVFVLQTNQVLPGLLYKAGISQPSSTQELHYKVMFMPLNGDLYSL